MIGSRALPLVPLLLALVAGPPVAGAGQPAKVPRIGFLSPRSSAAQTGPLLNAFRQGLREAGYVEGQNIAIEYRWADGNLDRVAQQAVDLVRLQVDVIVADVGPAIEAAKRASNTVPIVFADSADPVGTGQVASLARPGGNVTGMSSLGADLMGKRLQFLQETVPNVARVAILYSPRWLGSAMGAKEARAAAPALGLTVLPVAVHPPYDLDRAFDAMAKGRADALVSFGGPFDSAQQKRIVELAARKRLPAIYTWPEFARAGGLMAYGPNFPEMYRRAAAFVAKILKGAKPADIPVEQPTKFDLVINLKAAEALGLTFPQGVLIQATEVIR
ncbi:MAG TPA: ABC transporter substrate-binding protein [Candidatus Methylomirabilis sp.]